MPMPELQRIVRLTSFERMPPSLRHWLSRPPAERVAAVEFLRGQIDGAAPIADRGVYLFMEWTAA